MTDRARPREIVLDLLMEVMENHSYSHIALRQALGKYQYLEKQDRSFISRVFTGTLEYLYQIDFILDQTSKVPSARMKPLIRNLLRMSVYQLCYMDRIPASAVCNEAVKLAERRRFQGLKGYVNGVLRTVARREEPYVWPDPSVSYCLPPWLYERWSRSYGEETTRRMAQSFLEKAPTTVRCNLSLASRQEILDSLKGQGVAVKEDAGFRDLLYLESYDYMEDLEAFAKGWIQAQDLSSSLVGRAACPSPGDYCIDVCGAPGGKALHLADLLGGTGRVDVRDLTWQKVSLLEDNIRRSGFSNIEARAQDALEPDPDSVGKADILLADLPCSGLGILRRKPDIRYKMDPEQLPKLASLQRQILSVVHTYVKPGGILIYSTCTVNPMENEENADWIEGELPMEPVDLTARLGDAFDNPSLKKGRLQLLPGIDPCDGFFLSVFRNK